MPGDWNGEGEEGCEGGRMSDRMPDREVRMPSGEEGVLQDTVPDGEEMRKLQYTVSDGGRQTGGCQAEVQYMLG